MSLYKFYKESRAYLLTLLGVSVLLGFLYLVGTLTGISLKESDLPYSLPKSLTLAFSKRGLILAGFLILFLIVFIISIRGKRDNKLKDQRGFFYSKEGDHGTAGWLSEKEMSSVLEIKPVSKTSGIILGELNQKIVSLPADTKLNKHMCVIGASGTMKSRAIVRNNLFQIIKREESVVITDPKGEMYTDTAHLFKQAGYTIRVFNLKNPDESDRWNALSRLSSDDLSEIQILAGNIINNTTDGAGFWDDGALNLLTALMLYKMSDPDDKEHSLPAVYRMISTYTLKEITALFDRLPLGHPAKVPFKFFSDASDTVKASHYTGLGVRLQILQNPKVCRILEGKGMNLLSLGKKKCAYFVIMSDNDSTLKFVSSMFFSSLIKKLSDYADSLPEKRLKVPVNFWLDEFNNIGKIGASEDGSDFARAQSVIRSRNMNLVLCIQSIGQLQNRYPKNVWAELLGNCDTVLMLGCNDEITAKYVSKRSGIMTILQESTSMDKRSIALSQMIPVYRESESKGKRYLLNEDEVYTLSADEMIVILRSKRIFKLKKFDYTRHPANLNIIKKDPDQYRSEKLKRKPIQTEKKADKKESGPRDLISNQEFRRFCLSELVLDDKGHTIQENKNENSKEFKEEALAMTSKTIKDFRIENSSENEESECEIKKTDEKSISVSKKPKKTKPQDTAEEKLWDQISI